MAPRPTYVFAGCRFEPFNARLLGGSRVTPLTPKAVALLEALVRNANVLVSKNALMEAAWPNLAVQENNLNQQILTLRRTLDLHGVEGAIETVSRLGYRFIAPVQVLDGVPAFPLPQSTAGDLTRSRVIAPARSPVLRWTAAALVVAALAGVGWLTWTWREGRSVLAERDAALARGRQFLQGGNMPGALAELQTAIAIDPQNAAAHNLLAHALFKSSFQQQPRRRGESAVVAAAERAVALDPTCGPCHGTLGLFLFYVDWRWSAAERHLVEAIQLAPDTESIRPSYALLLLATGRLDDALWEIDVALARRSHELSWQVMRSTILYLMRRYDEAIAATDRALAIDDAHRMAWEWRSKALFQAGRGAEAVNALARVAFAHRSAALEAAVDSDDTRGGLLELLRSTDDWTQRAEQAWRRGPWRMLLGDHDGALAELEAAYERRNVNLVYIGTDPVWDPVRADPRFQRVIDGMELGEWFGARNEHASPERQTGQIPR